MSTCNSVNLVKGNGLKTILSFCNNTGKQTLRIIFLLSAVNILSTDFKSSSGLFPLGLNWSNIQSFESSFFTFLIIRHFQCILKSNRVLEFSLYCDTRNVQEEERRVVSSDLVSLQGNVL